MPLALAIKYAFGMMDGDDEEEELANFLRYYFREIPGTGFGVTWSADQILFMYLVFTENYKEAANIAVDLYPGAFLPTAGQLPADIARTVVDKVIED